MSGALKYFFDQLYYGFPVSQSGGGPTARTCTATWTLEVQYDAHLLPSAGRKSTCWLPTWLPAGPNDSRYARSAT